MSENNFDSLFKIHCICYEKNIFPWQQKDLYTPFWRFYWNPLPGGRLIADDKEIIMDSRHFYLIPGYLRFSTAADAAFDQFFIHFNFSSHQPALKEICIFEASARETDLIKNFISRPQSEENRILNHLTALSVLAPVLLRLPEKLLTQQKKTDRRILCAIKSVVSDYSATPGNDELAAMLGMSRNGFIRLFEQETGVPPQRYFKKLRIENACEYLKFSRLTIEEIAEKTGFADRFHFSRVFRQVMRMSPAAFRKLP